METEALSRPEALVVPRAEHPAHNGPCRAVDTESRLARKRGCSEQWGQQLNHIKMTWGRLRHGLYILKNSYLRPSALCDLSSFRNHCAFLGWARAWSVYSTDQVAIHLTPGWTKLNMFPVLATALFFYFYVLVTALNLQCTWTNLKRKWSVVVCYGSLQVTVKENLSAVKVVKWNDHIHKPHIPDFSFFF